MSGSKAPSMIIQFARPRLVTVEIMESFWRVPPRPESSRCAQVPRESTTGTSPAARPAARA
ncbi:MAG: hypothetical protein HZY78_09885 [Burkholderiaceae bacterium]|nr:MAG: hypothetical protein HZY78_09885 [Burkholderiaceae bacterium]